MNQPLLFAEAEIPLARKGWQGTERWYAGRFCAWINPAHPGVTIRHCCHPTAIRPYYIVGLPIGRKFYNLRMAQDAVANPGPYIRETEELQP